MPRDQKPASSPASGLLVKLLKNPQLPAYIPQLDTPVLARLIDHLGKDDAREIIALASAEQIQDLIEVDAWHSATPGGEETFALDKFLEWLELWSDMSPAFLVEKLRGLGTELFARALNEYVVVVDIDEVGVLGEIDVFNRFGVMPIDTETWPQIFQLLGDAWDEDAELVEEALARCCQRRSLLMEKTHIAGNDVLHHDVDGARDQHRQAQGYVTSTEAAEYLAQIRHSSLDKLLIEVRYDLLTGIKLAQTRRRNAKPAEPKATSDGDSSLACNDSINRQRAFQEIDRLLVDAQIVEPTPATLLLTASNAREELLVKQQLRQLADDNAPALQARLDETVYLANLLMAGTALQGKKLTEAQAAECVYSTCNLGLAWCLYEEPWDNEDAILKSLLENEPGLIKAFRIGYHLLSKLEERSSKALEETLRSFHVWRALSAHPWIQQRIKQEFVLTNLRAAPRHERFDRTRALIETLAMACDSNSCEQLRMLCDALPCFPESLARQQEVQVHVNKRWRFIREPADLRILGAFLDTLPRRLV